MEVCGTARLEPAAAVRAVTAVIAGSVSVPAGAAPRAARHTSADGRPYRRRMGGPARCSRHRSAVGGLGRSENPTSPPRRANWMAQIGLDSQMAGGHDGPGVNKPGSKREDNQKRDGLIIQISGISGVYQMDRVSGDLLYPASYPLSYPVSYRIVVQSARCYRSAGSTYIPCSVWTDKSPDWLNADHGDSQTSALSSVTIAGWAAVAVTGVGSW